MNSKEQLIDSGAIIGYRPDIKFNKEPNTIGNIIEQRYLSDDTGYTETIKSYLDSLPNQVISDFTSNIITINDIIDRLKKCFNERQYEEYSNIESFIGALESGNNVYSEEFLNYHKNNIVNSQIPEIIKVMFDEKNRLTVISDTLKMLYYGTSNITNEECEDKDNELSEILKEKDILGVGIDYLTLSYDSVLNKTLDIYSSKIDSRLITLEDIIYDETQDTLPVSLISSVNYLFNEVNEEENDRINVYNIQQTIEATKKALYNYYIKRNELKDFYNIVVGTQTEESYLLSKISLYENKVKNAIEEVNRAMVGNVFYMNTITSLMNEKQQLRTLYATNSYNL